MHVEAWEGMQRQGQDIVDRFNSLAQGFSCLLHSQMSSSGVSGLSLTQVSNGSSDCNHDEQGIPIWPWPSNQERSNQERKSIVDKIQFDNGVGRQTGAPRVIGSAKGNGAMAILQLGQRLGQAGANFEARLGGIVQHVAWHLRPPFRQECGNILCAPSIKQSQSDIAAGHMEWREADEATTAESTSKVPVGRLWKGYGAKRQSYESHEDHNEFDDIPNEDGFFFSTQTACSFSQTPGERERVESLKEAGHLPYKSVESSTSLVS